MTTLVTGAAGFIGFHLSKRLLERGEAVVGLDEVNDYYDIGLKEARLSELNEVGYGEFAFHRSSIEDYETLHKVCEESNVTKIVNLAAQASVRYSVENPGKYVQSNIAGFVNILELSRRLGIEHLVYASSSSVYGDSHSVPFSTSAPVNKPVSVYAATKLADELLAHVYYHQYNLKVTGLRFFTVYGPWGRPDMSPFLFLDAMLRGESIQLFNNGRHKRDFTYIDDVIEGVVRVLDSDQDADCRVYNIGRGEPVRLLDYVKTMEKLVGVTSRKKLMPMQAGDVEETFADVDPLEADFGYRPQTTLAQGLEGFVGWYRSYYRL
jgi:UDP-glucuronate 4-epimerase